MISPNVETLQLADDFIRQSKNTKNKTEFMTKLSEYEKRIAELQKPWKPVAQIQQLIHQTKNNGPVLHNPFLSNDDNQRRNYRTASSSGFRNYQFNGSGNEFFRSTNQQYEIHNRFGNNGQTQRYQNLGLVDVMTQLSRPKDQFPFQNNQLIKEQHIDDDPQFVKFYKKQIQVSPFHARKF